MEPHKVMMKLVVSHILPQKYKWHAKCIKRDIVKAWLMVCEPWVSQKKMGMVMALDSQHSTFCMLRTCCYSIGNRVNIWARWHWGWQKHCFNKSTAGEQNQYNEDSILSSVFFLKGINEKVRAIGDSTSQCERKTLEHSPLLWSCQINKCLCLGDRGEGYWSRRWHIW